MTDATTLSPPASAGVEAELRMGLFDAAGLRFGVEIDALSEVCVAGTLLPMVTARPEVLGSLNLRGNIIPVLDPLALCGMPRSADPPFLVAVLRDGGRLIGLGIDKTQGISQFPRAALQDLYSGDGDRAPVIRYSILDGETPVNVIESQRIFAERDLPSCPAIQSETRGGTGAAGVSTYLTFEAGGATFGLEATRIFGTVPRQRIEAGAVSGSRCMGIIHYLNRKVPIVECSDLIGLGSGIATDTPEIVVVRLPNDRLVGLAVDVIRRMQLLQQSALKPAPAQLAAAGSMICAAYLEPDGGQVFLLDADLLDQDPDLQNIAMLSDIRPEKDTRQNMLAASREEGRALAQDAADTKRPKVDRRKRRMLIYHAGLRLVTELTDVVCILEYPARVTPLHNQAPALIGFFSFKGESALLVDLAVQMGKPRQAVDAVSRVLLVQSDAAKVGFLVHSIEGIQNAELSYKDEDGRLMSKLPGRDMVSAMDLAELGTSLSIQF